MTKPWFVEKSNGPGRGPDFGRRAFQQGRHGGEAIRPPWSVADFLDLCTRCGDCVRECPEDILRPGDRGYPEVRFQNGGCSFCGDCADACAAGAIQWQDYGLPWRLLPSFAPSCLAARGSECHDCFDPCEHRAIRFRMLASTVAQPVVHADKCTGCGACVASCPVKAIAMVQAP